jgi:hypothetical protein
VLEHSGHPAVHAVVAFLALRRISQCYVVGRSRLLKCFQVATDALGGQALAIELAYSAGFVAGITIRHRVGANQRKTILMLVDGMDRHLPAIDLVAEVAFRSVFAPVDVSMTILAIAPDVGKNGIDVAVLAAHIAVQATQRKTCLAVIELKLAANRPPCRNGVALLAGDGQRTVGTLRLRSGQRLPLRECAGGKVKYQEREKQDLIPPERFFFLGEPSPARIETMRSKFLLPDEVEDGSRGHLFCAPRA